MSHVLYIESDLQESRAVAWKPRDTVVNFDVYNLLGLALDVT